MNNQNARIKILKTGILLLTMSLAFLACSEDPISGSPSIEITGSFTYSPIFAEKDGISVMGSPVWQDETQGQTVTYAIAPVSGGDMPDQIIISNTGIITVAPDGVLIPETTYTVTATGSGNFHGSIDTTISIAIIGKLIIGTFTYDALSTSYGTGATSSPPIWKDNPTDQEVVYGIAPPVDGSKTGIEIDEITGIVTIKVNAPAQTNSQYTITATGKGIFGGIITGTIDITVTPIDISGTFSYDILSTSYGTEATSNAPVWQNALPEQEVEYSITPPEDGSIVGIEIDKDSGVVTIKPDAPLQTNNSYSITATGTGNYVGTLTSTIDITVTEAIITGTFSYIHISAYKEGEAVESSPNWQDEPQGQTVKYAIVPAEGGDLPEQITISDTGTITVTPNGNQLTEAEYKVTATGTGYFKGSIETAIIIAIADNMITGTFTYGTISITYGTEATGNVPDWTGNPTEQEVRYSIKPPVDGIDINIVTGAITVSPGVPVQNSQYTITATGTGNYGGIVTATIEITVAQANITGTFSYNNIITSYGTEANSNRPNWNNNQINLEVEYSISPQIGNSITGIEINKDTGVITVKKDAPLQVLNGYTITAVGIGNYTGTLTAEIKITVQKADITGTFTYKSIHTPLGTEAISHEPEWNNNLIDQEVVYSITPAVEGDNIAGITIAEDTGVITVDSTVPLQSSKQYIITATGTGHYDNFITAILELTVYNPDAIPGAPTIEKAVADQDSFRVTWAPPTDTGYINDDGTIGIIIKYKVYYDKNSGFAIDTAEGSMESTDVVAILSELNTETTYYFKVTAFNAIGEGPPSEEIVSTSITTDHTLTTITLADGSTTSVWILKSNTDYVLAEAGTFIMGAQKTNPDGLNYDPDSNFDPPQGAQAPPREFPVHKVTIGSFYISRYEVTQDEYNTVMGENPSSNSGADKKNYPVELVSWYDAVVYCNELSEREGLKKVYTITRDPQNYSIITSVTPDWSKNGYRLPTEAEWEYAARGGKNSKGFKYSGGNDNMLDNVSNKSGGEVGTKKPNELGLYDMSGNVSEWVWDRNGTYDSEDQINPTGPETGYYRIVRGGGKDYPDHWHRNSSRYTRPPDTVLNNLGFRIVRSVID